MKNIVIKIIILIVFIGTTIVLFNSALERVDQYLKIKALDDCSKSVRYERVVTEENVKINTPVQDLYQQCVTEKGY